VQGGWIGGYPVGELIGWGGFASVYRTHGPVGTPLVLKVADQRGQGQRTFALSVRPACAVAFQTGSHYVGARLDLADVREMFRAEAIALRSAAGHRLPRLFDEQPAEGGSPVLVMEELTAPWALEQAPVEDFARILDACADLQRAGLAGHGDLKPEHVFVDADGEFVFIDPGYQSDRFGTRAPFRTLTPEYNPYPYVSAAAADVCATAVMVYRRLTGGFPWLTEDWRATALSHLSALSDGTMLPSHDACALSAVAGWAKLVFGWLVAVLSAGGGLPAAQRAEPCRPRWLTDHLAAAAQLREAIAGHTPELP